MWMSTITMGSEVIKSSTTPPNKIRTYTSAMVSMDRGSPENDDGSIRDFRKEILCGCPSTHPAKRRLFSAAFLTGCQRELATEKNTFPFLMINHLKK
jgi:hypothetical protein